MQPLKQLSPRQRQIYGYIKEFRDSHGYPPALRQIRDALKISSTSVVAYNLRALADARLILLTPGAVRSITLLDVEIITPAGRRLRLADEDTLSKEQAQEFARLVDTAYASVTRHEEVLCG